MLLGTKQLSINIHSNTDLEKHSMERLPNEILSMILAPDTSDSSSVCTQCLSSNIVHNNDFIYHDRHFLNIQHDPTGCFCTSSPWYRSLRLVSRTFNSHVAPQTMIHLSIVLDTEHSLDRLNDVKLYPHLAERLVRYSAVFKGELLPSDGISMKSPPWRISADMFNTDFEKESLLCLTYDMRNPETVAIFKKSDQTLRVQRTTYIYTHHVDLLSRCPHLTHLYIDSYREHLFPCYSIMVGKIFKAYLAVCHTKLLTRQPITHLAIDCLLQDIFFMHLQDFVKACEAVEQLKVLDLGFQRMIQWQGFLWEQLLGRFVRAAKNVYKLRLHNLGYRGSLKFELLNLILWKEDLGYSDKVPDEGNTFDSPDPDRAENETKSAETILSHIYVWPSLADLDLSDVMFEYTHVLKFLELHKSTLLVLSLSWNQLHGAASSNSMGNLWEALFSAYQKAEPSTAGLHVLHLQEVTWSYTNTSEEAKFLTKEEIRKIKDMVETHGRLRTPYSNPRCVSEDYIDDGDDSCEEEDAVFEKAINEQALEMEAFDIVMDEAKGMYEEEIARSSEIMENWMELRAT